MNKLVRFIGDQLRSPRLWAGVLTASIMAVLVIALFSASGHWAFAADNSNSSVNELMKTVWGAIIGALTKLAAWMLNLLTLIITQIILPNQKNLLTGPEVRGAWEAIRGISNILFFVALFIFSIMIITRQGGYNFKKSVTALLTAAALANLSLQIGLFIIEIGDALRNSASHLAIFNQPVTGDAPKNLKEWFETFSTTLASLEEDKGVALSQYFIATSAVFVQMAVMVYVFFRLAFILVERAIRLAMLLIFAPFQAVISILPQKELQNLGSNWFGEMIKWTLVLPVSFIIIGISRLLLPNPASNVTAFTAMVKGLGASTDSGGADLGGVFLMIAGIGTALAAATAPKMLSVVPQGISSLLSRTQNTIVGGAKNAWKYTGGAAIKSAKTNAGNIAKNAGFKLATSTKLGQSIYSAVAGNIERRKQVPEQQAKQRQLFVQKAANLQIRGQYLATQNRVKANRDRIAQLLYGGKSYSQLDEKQKDRVNQAYRSPASWAKGGVLASQGWRSNPLTMPRSGDLAALEAIEGKYMGIVGKAVSDEYDIGKSPEDTKKMFEDSRAKLLANPNDSAAQWDMVIATEVLRRQGLRNPGRSGERAAEYYNEIVSDPTNLKLRTDAGAPAKFSTAPLNRGASVADTGQAYEEMTVSGREASDLQSRIYDRTSRDFAGQPELARGIATADERTLRFIVDAPGSAARTATVAALGNSGVAEADISRVANGTLSPQATTNINQILNRADLDETGKATAINAVLTSEGIANPASATAISQALSMGITMNQLHNAYTIAQGVQTGGATSTAITEQIQDLLNLQPAQQRQADAQRVVESIDSRASYDEAVKGAVSSGGVTAADLQAQAQALISKLAPNLTAGMSRQTASAAATGLTSADYDQIANLLKTLKLDRALVPNTKLSTGVDVSSKLNVGQILDVLHQTATTAGKHTP